MPLVTFEQARKYAGRIARLTGSRQMPPWFADRSVGRFANDPSLSDDEIATLSAWAENGTPAGDPRGRPPRPQRTGQWSIGKPDAVVRMPGPVKLPGKGVVDYTYEIVPTGFSSDRWVQMSEVQVAARGNVHHAVIYIRPPDSNWLRKAPAGVPFTAADLPDRESRLQAHATDSDMLLVYAPGSSPDHWAEGMAKFIPAGSDLVFQMHYTTSGRPAVDQTAVGLRFAAQPPEKRVVTLQLTNHALLIPPGADNFEVDARGTLPNDALLLSLFPHMHLRGKRFEYDIVRADGKLEPLLRVNYHFHWQLSYKLAEPLLLKAGTVLEARAWYDNSARNPHNPDPGKLVHWGDQTSDEMMVGFFDVAIPVAMNKWQFFEKKP
ncbi:MAG: thiol-disulfide isomerase [Acidobacteria bacterium]|nr:thiol-disulfide isomerase [Acidobacteriota bacterium]